MRYRALVDLMYPTDRRILARLRAGEVLKMRERGDKFVAAGEWCDDIPKEAIPAFLAKGRIEEVTLDDTE